MSMLRPTVAIDPHSGRSLRGRLRSRGGTEDAQRRTHLVQSRDPGDGNTGFPDIQRSARRQCGERAEPCIRDPRVPETERDQLGQAGEVDQAGIGNRRSVKRKALQACQPTEPRQTGVADLGAPRGRESAGCAGPPDERASRR